MEKIKVISFSHADGSRVSELVEEEINKFLADELPKLGGKLKDIKIVSSATGTRRLLTAMIVYTVGKP